MTIEEKIKQIEATGWLIHSGNRQEGIILLRKQINELLQMQAKNLQQSDVGGTLSDIEKLINTLNELKEKQLLPIFIDKNKELINKIRAIIGSLLRLMDGQSVVCRHCGMATSHPEIVSDNGG
mgnify:CR=1 FL=1